MNKRGTKAPQSFKFSTAPTRRVGRTNLNKRGQFYLIAAILIIVVVYSVVSIRRVPQSVDEIDLSHLTDELELETGYVIAHGVYTHQSDLDSLMEQWIDKYFEYSKGEIDKGEWYFLYGDQERVDVISFANVDSIISLTAGGQTSTVLLGNWIRESRDNVEISNQKVQVRLFDEYNYEFDLREGENFFFVLSKERGEERVIVTEESGRLVL